MTSIGLRRHAFGILLGLGAISTSLSAQTWMANLSGSAEVPPNASPATGFALFTLVGNTLTINGSFSGLTGNTTASHLHCCTAVPLTGNAAVATTTPSFIGFPLGVTGGSFNIVLDLTSSASYNPVFVTANGGSLATAQATLLSGINSGQVYLNIHTQAFPGGEIRGFVTTVPEPSSVLLMASGLAACAFMARRRRSTRQVQV